jgi:hypothetical protein
MWWKNLRRHYATTEKQLASYGPQTLGKIFMVLSHFGLRC